MTPRHYGPGPPILPGMTTNPAPAHTEITDDHRDPCPAPGCSRVKPTPAGQLFIDSAALWSGEPRSIDAATISGDLIATPLEVAAARVRDARARHESIVAEMRAHKARGDALEQASREAANEVSRAHAALVDAAEQG